MLISHDLISHTSAPCVAALGFFDGVHLGHRAVIAKAVSRAQEMNAACGLFTFEPPRHTSRAVSKTDVSLLQTVARRQVVMKSLGVELLVCPPFESFYNLSSEAFVLTLLRDAMHCVAVVCGEDYRFGCRGSGDVAMLRSLCAAEGIEVDTVPAVMYEGEVVSSTRIRECLRGGSVSLANAMLCEPYRIDGFAVPDGKNFTQCLPHGMMAPREGRYRCEVLWNGRRAPSVVTVEMRGEPAFCTVWPFEGEAPERQIITVEILSEDTE